MIFAQGLSAPEGPVVLPEGGWLIVEMGLDRGCVSRLSRDGAQRTEIVKTGRPNGLALDRAGNLYVAESLDPAFICMSVDGQTRWAIGEGAGTPFLWPNDIAIGPDGMLYMTDSGVHQPVWYRRREANPSETSFDDVDGKLWRVDPRAREAVMLDSGLRFANGIAFGPDNDLYVTETITGNVYRYRWPLGDSPRREMFGNVHDPAKASYRGPDGMAFGQDGNLYVAVVGQGDVTVLGSDGSIVRRIPVEGRRPTNVCFGPHGERRIYVTETELGRIEAFDVDTSGLSLHE